ncbi:MAG: carboxypeptidase regulatory-like domain-containing protein [Verrucomicrobiales bacterium]|nr:carboxypeptidase regulatory-like domain-containing protein [Verrucomicrobiales bacterium]
MKIPIRSEFTMAVLGCVLVGAVFAADALAPVTVRVVDELGGGVITNFSYTWWFAAPGASSTAHEGTASNGQFVVLAPERCELNCRISAPDLVAGHGQNRGSFVVNKTNREFVLQANRGVRVRGTVVEAATGIPIAGAEVSPIIFRPPLFAPDRSRSAITDAEGRFELGGVEASLGVGVLHPRFQEEEHGFNLDQAKVNTDGSLEVRIKLGRGTTLEGVVTDSTGNSLAGATVETGEGKEATTDSNGRFHFEGLPSQGPSMLIVRKSGFVERWLFNNPAKNGRIEIVLETRPELKGRVIDPEGRRVTNFTVWAGPEAEPGEYSCSRTNGGPEGVFRLSIEEQSETNWIGVAAPGFAPWFGHVGLTDLQREVLCPLEPGTEVRLRAIREGPPSAGLHAKLRLLRTTPPSMVNPDDPSMQQLLATSEAQADARGVMHFEHLRPGRYRLAIRGAGISPLGMDVTVGNTPLDLGNIRLQGTGTIAGRIYPSEESHVPPAYARGEIYHVGAGLNDDDDRELTFTADAEGRFQVGNVPVGEVQVHLPYWASADILDAIVRHARVVDGRATEVTFFEPEQRQDLRIRFRIGDGSPGEFDSGSGREVNPPVDNVTTRSPMFWCMLHPLGTEPISWDPGDWEEMDAEHTLVLHDVKPGAYHLQVLDWHGSTGLQATLLETNVEMQTGPQNLQLQLGAGSIGGTVEGPEEDVRFVHILAANTATPRLVRETWSDSRGHFCLRFLEAGSYAVFAHDHESGWCDLGMVSVSNKLARCSSGRLQHGGSLEVELADATKPVVARDEGGRRLEPDWRSTAPRLFFHHLWPGRWTIESAEDHRSLTNVVLRTDTTTHIALPPITR